MPDEQSFVDAMADTDPPENTDGPSTGSEGEGGAGDGSPPVASPPNPDITALADRVSKAEERAFAAEQRAAFYAGQAARVPTEPVAEAPKPFQFNKEEFAAALEKDPAAAIADLVQNMNKSGVDTARREIEQNVEGKLTQAQRTSELRSRLEREGQEVSREYADYIGNDASGKPKNQAFDAACFDYAQTLATENNNPIIREGPHAGSRMLTPGMMRAAADAVYGRFVRDGKIQTNQPKSIRQVSDQVRQSDSLGSNGANRNGAASKKTIESLLDSGWFKSEQEVKAARNWLKTSMPGVSEEAYVRNIEAARKNGEFSGRS